MSSGYTIRLITEQDAAGALAVYSPYVLNTVITFEYQAPGEEEWKERIRTVTAEYPWLVCEANGEIAGYAYAYKHKARSAYDWSVDSAVYVKEQYHGSGIARKLYTALFEILRQAGYFNVYAGITLPNIKSEKFHASFGFEEIGVYKNVGYKNGAWRNVGWYALRLTEHIAEPKTPVTISNMPPAVIDTILNQINH